jgi:transcription elongation factor Elf1
MRSVLRRRRGLRRLTEVTKNKYPYTQNCWKCGLEISSASTRAKDVEYAYFSGGAICPDCYRTLKQCPLKFSTIGVDGTFDTVSGKCTEKQCPWWIEKRQQCAKVALVSIHEEQLQHSSRLHDDINKTLQRNDAYMDECEAKEGGFFDGEE